MNAISKYRSGHSRNIPVLSIGLGMLNQKRPILQPNTYSLNSIVTKLQIASISVNCDMSALAPTNVGNRAVNRWANAPLPTLLAMKRSRLSKNGFTLIEVALALAVVSVCLISIVGLLTVSLSLNQNVISQTTATAIASSIVADVRSIPPTTTPSTTTTTSARYLLNIASSQVTQLYFDIDGNVLANNTNAIFGASITIAPSAGTSKSITLMQVMVYWPVNATATTMHHVETTSLVDRN